MAQGGGSIAMSDSMSSSPHSGLGEPTRPATHQLLASLGHFRAVHLSADQGRLVLNWWGWTLQRRVF